MKTLIVVSHPREDSLTIQISKAIKNGIISSNGEVEFLDLYRENFNPIMTVDDEAEYDNIHKAYSDTVLKEMNRIKTVDVIIFVFPIYWHSLPAMLKGYIDRVFNYGFAYGNGNRLPIKKIRWMPLAGNIRSKYKKRGYNLNIEHQLNIGISDYVGVEDSEVDFVWNSLGEYMDEVDRPAYFEQLLRDAFNYGENLNNN